MTKLAQLAADCAPATVHVHPGDLRDAAYRESVVAGLHHLDVLVHCAAAATPSARARIEFGKISPSNTQTSGPQLAPKKTTNRFAATSAIGPHAPLSTGPDAPAVA